MARDSIKSLPQWAQDKIIDLETQVSQLRGKLDELQGESQQDNLVVFDRIGPIKVYRNVPCYAFRAKVEGATIEIRDGYLRLVWDALAGD